jgi:DoxX-like protein
MNKQQIKTAAFWATTIFGPTSFVIGGVIALEGGPEVLDGVHHLGYPLYFATILGVWKLLGAITITVPGLPRLKEWAYAGFVFDLTGAAISHAAVRDGAGDIAAPLVFLALVAASWALRPASRRLGATAEPAAQAPVRIGAAAVA